MRRRRGSRSLGRSRGTRFSGWDALDADVGLQWLAARKVSRRDFRCCNQSRRPAARPTKPMSSALFRGQFAPINPSWRRYKVRSSAQAEGTGIRVRDLGLSEGALTVALMNRDIITVPLAWYPPLAAGTPEQRAYWEWPRMGGLSLASVPRPGAPASPRQRPSRPVRPQPLAAPCARPRRRRRRSRWMPSHPAQLRLSAPPPALWRPARGADAPSSPARRKHPGAAPRRSAGS